MIKSLFTHKTTKSVLGESSAVSDFDQSSAIIVYDDQPESQIEQIDQQKIQCQTNETGFPSSSSPTIIKPNIIKVQPRLTKPLEKVEVGREQMQRGRKKRRQIKFKEIHQQKHIEEKDGEDSIDESKNEQFDEQNQKKKETISTVHESITINKEHTEELCEENFRILHKQDNLQNSYQHPNSNHSDQMETNQNISSEDQDEDMDSSKKKTFEAASLYDLLFCQIPSGCIFDCLIVCRKQFLSTKRSYDLFLKNQKRYLVTAIKNRINIASKFQLKQNPYKESSRPALGELCSNFSGMEYVLKTKNNGKQVELLYIQYNPNLLGLENRNVHVIQNSKLKIITSSGTQPFSLIKNYTDVQKDQKNLSVFQHLWTKPPTKGKNGQYQLDLKGIACSPSINNCVLEDKFGKPVLILGKITDKIFSLQIICNETRLSIGEAFAIGVSNLDTKLLVR